MGWEGAASHYAFSSIRRHVIQHKQINSSRKSAQRKSQNQMLSLFRAENIDIPHSANTLWAVWHGWVHHLITYHLPWATSGTAPSFHCPHTNGEVFLNSGVVASHRAREAYGRGRWWLISGIGSNSDSWYPTSQPLIRTARSVMDVAQPLSEDGGPAGGNKPRSQETVTQVHFFFSFHFQEGSVIVSGVVRE